MGESITHRLEAEISEIMANADPVDIAADVNRIAARLANDYPEAGLSVHDIAMKLMDAATGRTAPSTGGGDSHLARRYFSKS